MVNKFGQMVNELLSVNYFLKNVPSWMLDKVPNTFLNLCFKAVYVCALKQRRKLMNFNEKKLKLI